MNIIFEGLYGSRLFELSNESSDLDIKAIYIPELKDVVKGKYKKTLNSNNKNSKAEKNDGNIIEKEIMSLQFFLEKMLEGQIVHIDMLFIPESKTLQTSDLWQYILDNRDKAISKAIIPSFRGYIYQQVGKYAKRVKKVEEAEEIVNILNQYSIDTVFESIFEANKSFFENNPKVTLDTHENVRCFRFMDKTYLFTTKNEHILDSLNKYIGRYGERVLELKNNENIDWKSLSHAFRGTYQLKHLALDGEYCYPLPERDYLLKIKNGELDFTILIDELMDEIENTLLLAEKSTVLPDEPDYEFWDDFLLNVYVNQIRNS